MMPDISYRPRVSVVIVFLNGERFLEEAIRSVFRQTYKEWELLLVDDGSTDASTGIARRYAEEHSERVRYLEHPGHANLGAAAARNLGLRHAQGEYIAFLDADDVYLPSKLEQQVPLLDSQPQAAMLYGRTRLWYTWDGNRENLWREELTKAAPRLDSLIQPPELATAHMRDEHVYPTTCSVLIRRTAIDAVGGFEESFRTTYEDMTLFIKLLLHYPAYVVDRCWDWYRKHPDSTWAVAERTGEYRSGRPYRARAVFLTWLEGYMRTAGVTDQGVWHAWEEEMRAYRRPLVRSALTKVLPLVQQVKGRLEPLAKRWLPIPVQDLIKHGLTRRPAPPVGWVRFGSLRRMSPISTYFGYDRGSPIDRYYIESFLEQNAADVRGRVLEVEEDTYTRRFGGTRIEAADILYLIEGHPQATIIADLTQADHIPSNQFDCIILTQTLQYIYDVRAAAETLHRILKPGGVLLATFPGIIKVDHDPSGASSQWSFTPMSTRRLFEEFFPSDNVTVEGHGNILTAISFLHGIAQEELTRKELDYNDPAYVVTNAVRAVKPAEAT